MAGKIKVTKKEDTKDMKCESCGCASCEECMCEDCQCEMCAYDSCGCGPCRCPHHYVRPGLIVAFGLAFLLNAFGVLNSTVLMYTWPSLVIAYGLMKMFEDRCSCCGGCC